jgi:hypothetical protein
MKQVAIVSFTSYEQVSVIVSFSSGFAGTDIGTVKCTTYKPDKWQEESIMSDKSEN